MVAGLLLLPLLLGLAQPSRQGEVAGPGREGPTVGRLSGACKHGSASEGRDRSEQGGGWGAFTPRGEFSGIYKDVN